MKIFINGQSHEGDFADLESAVAVITTAPSGIAAALNDRVIPRRDWKATVLSEGARVEVVSAVQGG